MKKELTVYPSGSAEKQPDYKALHEESQKKIAELEKDIANKNATLNKLGQTVSRYAMTIAELTTQMTLK